MIVLMYLHKHHYYVYNYHGDRKPRNDIEQFNDHSNYAWTIVAMCNYLLYMLLKVSKVIIIIEQSVQLAPLMIINNLIT